MADIQAVFFDLGGTLFSYRDFATSSAGLVHEMVTRLDAREQDESKVGLAYFESSGEAFARYADRSFYLHRDVFYESFRLFAEKIGGRADDDFYDWAYARMRVWMVESFQLRDDCDATLRALSEDGLYLSVVSNIDDDFLAPMIERAGLGDVLDHWSSSEEARSCKPDRAFFELALEKSGHRPEHVLFVGDSPEHDIAGARPLGMQTALISEAGFEPPGQTGLGADEHKEPHHHIRALDELIGIVREGASD
jgi:putative hydrolase of the HAD superfamily